MAESARGRRLVTMAQGLFILNSLIWIGIGVATMVRMAGERPAAPPGLVGARIAAKDTEAESAERPMN
jgi:hypothetical protein